jgi:Family of unknown function (DUF5764)
MNRGSDPILSVYSDARAEYTKQLCVFLVPAYFQFFIDLLEKAKQSTLQEPKKALWQFQTLLNEIHDWNMEKVNNEIHLIHTNCGCDYLDDLLTAVFIAHTKVLTAIRLSSNNKKVEINVPKVEHFLFKVLCETSKLLWSSTYLFRDGIPAIEKQQNYRTIEGILNEGILQAVRSLVPVKSILKDFVNMDSSDQTVEEDSDEDDDKKEESPKPESSTLFTTPPPTLLPSSPSSLQVKEETPEVVQQEEKPVEEVKEEKKNEVILPQTIVIDEKPGVRFGQFDAVFDLDHPTDSEMVYDPKESETEEHVPDLEILDESGVPLSDSNDFVESLDSSDEVSGIGIDDYEEL